MGLCVQSTQQLLTNAHSTSMEQVRYYYKGRWSSRPHKPLLAVKGTELSTFQFPNCMFKSPNQRIVLAIKLQEHWFQYYYLEVKPLQWFYLPPTLMQGVLLCYTNTMTLYVICQDQQPQPPQFLQELDLTYWASLTGIKSLHEKDVSLKIAVKKK